MYEAFCLVMPVLACCCGGASTCIGEKNVSEESQVY